jgi:hypothetical protein
MAGFLLFIVQSVRLFRTAAQIDDFSWRSFVFCHEETSLPTKPCFNR